MTTPRTLPKTGGGDGSGGLIGSGFALMAIGVFAVLIARARRRIT